MTEANLKSAFAGESQAHMSYTIYSRRAEKGGLPNIARLFRAVAYSERIHASNHYGNIRSRGDAVTVSVAGFGSRTTAEDLEIGIEGETFEVEEMYPAYVEVARMQKEYAAEVSFRYALEAEKTHAEFFRRAREAADDGRDLDLGPIGVCNACGYTVEGEIPEVCPICKARKNNFRVFSQ
ncbi:MAG: rubrerythrin family protein [Candidatus Bathyarchaeia archaeon]